MKHQRSNQIQKLSEQLRKITKRGKLNDIYQKFQNPIRKSNELTAGTEDPQCASGPSASEISPKD
jgi:hypothetical protein